MIELPEAVVLSGEINDLLAGKQILNVVAAQSPHKFAWYHQEPGDYHDLLANTFIEKSYNQGGFVRMDFTENKSIVFSEGVRIRYLKDGEKLPEKHQLLMEFSDHSHLVCSIQMYGGLCAFKENEYDNEYFSAARNKPSPFSTDFNETYFDGLIANSSEKLSLKAFLATEQRIPGLGNGVLHDILFNSGLHHKKKLNTVSDENKENLFYSVKTTLLEMKENGGRDTEQDLFGYPGNYQTILSKNTLGKPCQKCGSIIEKQSYMGGSIYLCPTCQKM